MNAEEILELIQPLALVDSPRRIKQYGSLIDAIREVCAERDRLQAELDRARKELFDLKIEANNPAWL